MNEQYGEGAVVRRLDTPQRGRVEGDGDIGKGKYARRNPRQVEGPKKRSTKWASGDIWAILNRSNPKDAVGPFFAFAEEGEVSFDRLHFPTVVARWKRQGVTQG